MIALVNESHVESIETDEVRLAIDRATEAQADWARRPTEERASLIGDLRAIIAENANALAVATAAIAGRPLAEKMVSEVLPLVDAARFLQKQAAHILRPRSSGRSGRPLWLQGSSFEIQRRPHGVILIVGAGNYPLFLPAVQMLHALVAGNAVVIKPAEGTSKPLEILRELMAQFSGIPVELVQLLPETKQAARDAARYAIDKVIFTGSSENGRDLLGVLAETNIPSVMELSGADSVFVRADADVSLLLKAIRFGLRLNAGNTCMAPQSVFVHATVAKQLLPALQDLGLSTDAIFVVQNDAEALQMAALNEHGLGASIFSRDEAAARTFAAQLATGFVTINDIIVSKADPRFPFGGVRASGFGVTRGAEGLLEMTYPHVVAVRRARFLPHLDEPQVNDGELFGSYLLLMHGRGWRVRWQALRALLRLSRERKRK